MTHPIRKAVIPAAGLGTRVLPATKAVPKEMLAVVDKPAIQYLAEEAAAAGIEEILIITSRGKSTLEDHFDRSVLLEQKLEATEKFELLEQIRGISEIANITYIRQKEQKGLGHAVLLAREFVGDEPFAVLYGDDVIIGETSATLELCEAFEKYGKPTAGIKPVEPDLISKYSSLKVNPVSPQIFEITDMIEKPRPGEEFSLYSILGRCVLTPEIFDILENTPPGAGGEIQLTDAMKFIARTTGMTGVEYSGTRYDMGDKFGVIKAAVDVGLAHPETGDKLKTYLRFLADSGIV